MANMWRKAADIYGLSSFTLFFLSMLEPVTRGSFPIQSSTIHSRRRDRDKHNRTPPLPPPPSHTRVFRACIRCSVFLFSCINREAINSIITKYFSVTIISANGSEDLALLPDGLVFVSSVSFMMHQQIRHFNIPSG